MKNNFNKKKIYNYSVGLKFFFSIALALLFLSFIGCTSSPNDLKYLDNLSKLQQKHGVSSAFSVNLATMNDYISEAAVLAGSASPASKKIIEAEIYSAQAFYYLNKALDDSQSLPYPIQSCTSKEFKSALSSASLSKDYIAKAVISISSLSDNDKAHLRAGQLEVVKGYEEKADALILGLKEKC